MSSDPRPVGFKLRFHADAIRRAEEVAQAIDSTPVLLEQDNSLPAGHVVMDVSYDNGDVQTDVDPEKFLD
jgi:hypothetical protein